MVTMYKPGVTLSMIVRNDADRLRRCLESSRDVSNRIVIVDTGSTDGSQLVAKDFKADLIEIEWPDAFDEARNVGFARVKTDWTLWLDSDEWFPDGEAEKLRNELKGSDFFGAALTRHDLNDSGVDDGTSIDLMRIWRTHPKMRVQGIVHENFPAELVADLARGKPIPVLGIRLLHDGYVGPLGFEKLERNLALLRKENELRPNRFASRVKLAEAMITIGDPEGITLMQTLADEVVSHPVGKESYAHSVIALTQSLDNYPEDQLNSERAVEWLRALGHRFGASPPALWSYARTSFKRGDLEQAKAALDRLAEFRQTGVFNRLAGVHGAYFGQALENNIAEVNRLLSERGATAKEPETQ